MTYSRDEIREMIWASFEAGMLSQQLRTPEPPEPAWEYAIHTADGAHIWPLGPRDEEIVATKEECVRAFSDDPAYWGPTDRIVRRTKAGNWETEA